MVCELSHILATHKGAGYVVAPAGYGKTYLIAESTARCVGRQLILTHTYAGVNALRNKMRMLSVKDNLYHIDTIASWSLRLTLAYSYTSNWNVVCPADNEQWSALYVACGELLDHEFIRRIVRASYTGVFVDEYQDCSVGQHSILLKLARDLPSRILGDPLQGIFDFRGQNPVSWRQDVDANFECLGVLKIPHRWRQSGRGELGEWLSSIRTKLEQGQPIDLRENRPQSVRYISSGTDPQTLLRSQGNACRYFRCAPMQTVIAIHRGSQEYKAKCHRLSRSLSGMYSSIEEVEGRDLFLFIRRINAAQTAAACLQEVIAFAKKCMTAVAKNLPAATLRGEAVGIRANTRNPDAAGKANAFLDAPTSAAMARFIEVLKETEGVRVVRADLLNRAMGVLRKHVLHPDISLGEAADKYHREFRYKGRLASGRRKLIGTTLLVKGLEFDHAIVLDATSLSKKELYVALTRGARSLTVISTNPVLSPLE
ncbi:AAA family ATPase [Alphaproteobacteria bacterium HT1-32]|nr:AAA family ATPase [Alphaproteobacteria bacterium HT1-32]